MEDQCLDLDMISMLPKSILEVILTLMPIRDAVRTSALSTQWRYKWANIPKIVLDEGMSDDLNTGTWRSTRRKLISHIYQILLMHHGPILEFIFENWAELNHFEIDQIILHLMRRNTLKKFTLDPCDDYYRLPSSFYSLHHLTHLNLMYGKLHPPLTFNGFKLLTNLSMDHVKTTNKMLRVLVSGCPVLKSFTLLNFDLTPEGGDESSFLQLFEFFPVVEHLHLSFLQFKFMFYAVEEIPRKLSTSLVHLKDLELSRWALAYEDYFSFALLLIRSSPNLEKIKIKGPETSFRTSSVFFEPQDYHQNVRLDHLVEFDIENFDNPMLESKFLNLILIQSPMLKKVHIKLSCKSDEEIIMLRSLLRLRRTSPMVEIISGR